MGLTPFKTHREIDYKLTPKSLRKLNSVKLVEEIIVGESPEKVLGYEKLSSSLL